MSEIDFETYPYICGAGAHAMASRENPKKTLTKPMPTEFPPELGGAGAYVTATDEEWPVMHCGVIAPAMAAIYQGRQAEAPTVEPAATEEWPNWDCGAISPAMGAHFRNRQAEDQGQA